MSEGPAILVVDDSPTNVELVRCTLASEGFRTLEANDGAAARSICRSQRPDLILLDVMMPGESGLETCARLKSDPVTADIPIIFLSALDDVTDKVAGLKIGGVDYISKPVHIEELLARVRVHLRIRATNRMLADQQRAPARATAHRATGHPGPSRRLPGSRLRASFSGRSRRLGAMSTTSCGSPPAFSGILWPISAATA